MSFEVFRKDPWRELALVKKMPKGILGILGFGDFPKTSNIGNRIDAWRISNMNISPVQTNQTHELSPSIKEVDPLQAELAAAIASGKVTVLYSEQPYDIGQSILYDFDETEPRNPGYIPELKHGTEGEHLA